MISTTTGHLPRRLVNTHAGLVVGAWTARSAFPVDIVLLYSEWEEAGRRSFTPSFYFHPRPVPVFDASLLDECRRHREFCGLAAADQSRGKLPRPTAGVAGWRSLDVGLSEGAADCWTSPVLAWRNACAFASTSVAQVEQGENIASHVTLSVEVGHIRGRVVPAPEGPDMKPGDDGFPSIEAEIASGRAAGWCRLISDTPRRSRCTSRRPPELEPANLEALHRVWGEAPYLFMLTPFNEMLRWTLRTKLESEGTDATGISTLTPADLLSAMCTQPPPGWRQKAVLDPSNGALNHGRFQQLVRAGFDRGWVTAFLDGGRARRDPAQSGAGTAKSAHLSGLIDSGAWDVVIPVDSIFGKPGLGKRDATRVLGEWFAHHGARWLTLLLGGRVALTDGPAYPKRLHLGRAEGSPSSLGLIRRGTLVVGRCSVPGAPWITGTFTYRAPVARSKPTATGTSTQYQPSTEE